jgi:hypothetical protein
VDRALLATFADLVLTAGGGPVATGPDAEPADG